MSLSRNIRARIELPCSIRFLATGLEAARGITEELSRESLVVIAFSAIRVERLSNSVHIAVAIELPHSREFKPRLLECAVSVSGVHLVDSGLRISAKVNRMSIKEMRPDRIVTGTPDTSQYKPPLFSAIEGSRNIHSVVHPNHSTHKTQGEHSMSFLKNLFTEEDGQDMVEYGLVIAAVVLAVAGLMSGFMGGLTAAFTKLSAAVTAAF
jgi:Flp pilus assembly pilin Flp